jgi:hypothetical protein
MKHETGNMRPEIILDKLLLPRPRATATATFKSKRATSHAFVKVHYVEVSTSGISRTSKLRKI